MTDDTLANVVAARLALDDAALALNWRDAQKLALDELTPQTAAYVLARDAFADAVRAAAVAALDAAAEEADHDCGRDHPGQDVYHPLAAEEREREACW